jgi:aminoglycoside phosphotransferase (APT) family kinase protein
MSVPSIEDPHPPAGLSTAYSESVGEWLKQEVSAIEAPLRWTQLTGGHSNLTFRVAGANGVTAVVRRPPIGELQKTAHDMRREFRVISALWPTDVPVPEPIAITDDPSITDAPIYAMAWVEGRSLFSRPDADAYLSTQARDRLSRSFIRTLANLHQVDPDAVGLGALGKRTSYVERQLRRWHSSLDQLSDVDDRMEGIYRLLISRVPSREALAIVHGDYGLHNCRVTPEGEVAAVLDWEISTLGDPLADLAYCINAWVEKPSESEVAHLAPTSLPGFWTRRALLDEYANVTGIDLAEIDYYRCFNHWKRGCILAGVVSRYRNGNKDASDVDLVSLSRRLCVAVELAVEAADYLLNASSNS